MSRSGSPFNEALDNPWWKNIKTAHGKKEMSNEEALRFLVTLDATKWQYTNGVRNQEAISPDNWHGRLGMVLGGDRYP